MKYQSIISRNARLESLSLLEDKKHKIIPDNGLEVPANDPKFCTCGGPKLGTVLPSRKNTISAEIGFYWFKPKTFQTSFHEIGFLPPLVPTRLTALGPGRVGYGKAYPC